MARGSGFYLADAINNWGTRLERDRLLALEREQRLADREEQRAEEERLRLARIAREDALIEDQRAYDETRRVQGEIDREARAESDFTRDERRRKAQLADQIEFEVDRADRLDTRAFAREAADYGIVGNPETDRARMAEELAVARIARQVEIDFQTQLGKLQNEERLFQSEPGQANLERLQLQVDAVAGYGDRIAARFDDADRALAARSQQQKTQAVLGYVNSLTPAQRRSSKNAELVKAISAAQDKSVFFDQLVSDYRITDPSLIKGLQAIEDNRSRLATVASQTIARAEQQGMESALGIIRSTGGRVSLPLSKGGLGTGLGGVGGQQAPAGSTGSASAPVAAPNFNDLGSNAPAATPVPQPQVGGAPAPQQPSALTAMAPAPQPATYDPYGASGPQPEAAAPTSPNAEEYGALGGAAPPPPPPPPPSGTAEFDPYAAEAAVLNDRLRSAAGAVGSLASPGAAAAAQREGFRSGSLAVPRAAAPFIDTNLRDLDSMALGMEGIGRLPVTAPTRSAAAPAPTGYPAATVSALANMYPAPVAPPATPAPTGPPIQRFNAPYTPSRQPLPGTGGDQAQRMQLLNEMVRQWLLENPPGR